MNRGNLLSLTIITIEKEYPEGLRRTLESLASQEIPKSLAFQHLICEGVPGLAKSLVQETQLSEISRICSSFDSGLYNGMNRGLNCVNDGWVMFLNAGDSLVRKSALQQIHDVLCESSAAVVQFRANYSDLTIRPFKPYSKYSLFFGRNMHIHPALCVNINLVRNLQFDESFKIAADYKMIIELIKNFEFQFSNSVISNFEGGGISATATATLIEEMNLVRNLTRPRFLPRIVLRIWNKYFEYRLKRAMET
jgi:hypothetical protein